MIDDDDGGDSISRGVWYELLLAAALLPRILVRTDVSLYYSLY